MSFNFLCIANDDNLPDGWETTLKVMNYPVAYMPMLQHKNFMFRPFLFMFNTEVSVRDLDRIVEHFGFFFVRYERDLKSAISHLAYDFPFCEPCDLHQMTWLNVGDDYELLKALVSYSPESTF